MKIAHLPFVYYPDAIGGTEVYVRELAHALVRAGHELQIFAREADSEKPEWQERQTQDKKDILVH